MFEFFESQKPVQKSVKPLQNPPISSEKKGKSKNSIKANKKRRGEWNGMGRRGNEK